MTIALLVALADAWSAHAGPAAGTLDGRFGRRGVVDLPPEFARLDGVHVDHRDRLVLSAKNVFGRLTPNGRWHRRFGRRGRVQVSRLDAVTSRVAIDTEDRLVIAGVAGGSVVLVRLTRTGRPDRTFGDRGVVDTRIAGAPRDVLVGDAGVTVAGDGAPGTIFIGRWGSDGTVDASFGDGGRTVLDLGVTYAHVVRAFPLATGAVLLAVNVPADPDDPSNLSPTTGALVRFAADGRVDSGFGGDGSGRVVFQAHTWIGSVASGIEPDTQVAVEKMAVVIHPGVVFRLAGYDANGGRSEGVLLPQARRAGFGNASDSAVVVDRDGTILVAWTFVGLSGPELGVERFASLGAFDPTFGNEGVVNTVIAEMPSDNVTPQMPIPAVQKGRRLVVGAPLCDAQQCQATLIAYVLR